jgi:hypothetical protein
VYFFGGFGRFSCGLFQGDRLFAVRTFCHVFLLMCVVFSLSIQPPNHPVNFLCVAINDVGQFLFVTALYLDTAPGITRHLNCPSNPLLTNLVPSARGRNKLFVFCCFPFRLSLHSSKFK